MKATADEIKKLEAAALRYRQILLSVKRAVEGLARQPKHGVMPWEGA